MLGGWAGTQQVTSFTEPAVLGEVRWVKIQHRPASKMRVRKNCKYSLGVWKKAYFDKEY